jgi:hypothetical protein
MPLHRQSLGIFQVKYLDKNNEIKIQKITVNLETNSYTESKIYYSKK